jgi:hypothetical protein
MKITNPGFVKLLAVPVLACTLILLACGGGSQKTDPPPSGGPFSGNWQFVLTATTLPPATKTESGFLVQSGNSLSGGVLLSDQTLCPGLGTAQGQLSGSNVAITVNQVAQTVNFTGTAASDGSSMSGDYSILASGCGVGSTVGTWTASQVKPVSGNYLATLTSGAQIGLTYTFTVTVAQGPNTGSSTANLSGSMTSNNAPCGGNLSITGLVSGSSVVFNLLASDGSAAGQFRGTTTTDATMLTGTYDFLPQNNGCSGDAGTIAMALQASM